LIMWWQPCEKSTVSLVSSQKIHPSPKAQPQPKAKPQKPLTDKEKAHREVIARYGGEANYKAGRGLGT